MKLGLMLGYSGAELRIPIERIRLAEKLGFRREGIARDAELIGDRYVDHVQYGLLCSDRESE